MKTYIFDTETLRIIETNEIFNSNIQNASFTNLVREYLEEGEPIAFEQWDIDNKRISDTIGIFNFELIHENENVGFRWNQGVLIYGSNVAEKWFFEISIPYSQIAEYLTPLGREIFGN